jgi:hypothetical protein
MIAGFETAHAIAHQFDDPCCLVTEHHGAAPGAQIAVDEMQITVTHTARDGAYQHFAIRGIVDGN